MTYSVLPCLNFKLENQKEITSRLVEVSEQKLNKLKNETLIVNKEFEKIYLAERSSEDPTALLSLLKQQ